MTEIIKEKEEVQEYLKNLGIEYRFSCYSEKNAEGCQLLGDYFSQIHSQHEKANKVWKENCDKRSYGRSCSSYGQSLLNARGCARNVTAALEYFSKACENNDATGCDYAGKLYCSLDPLYKDKVPADPKRGLRYLEHGCKLESAAQMFESAESCYAAAFVYALGVNGISKQVDKAIDLGTRACDMGQTASCKLVAQLYKRIGDQTRADKYYARHQMLKEQISSNLEIKMQRTE